MPSLDAVRRLLPWPIDWLSSLWLSNGLMKIFCAIIESHV
jgi:hypothetical protein